MRRRLCMCGVLAVALWIGMLCQVGSAEPDGGVAEGRQTFLREMRKKSPEARVQAVEAFARFPAAEIVEPLLKKGLADLDPSVRAATRAVLRTIGQEPTANQFLVDEFKRYTKRQSNQEVLSGLLGGMIATPDEVQLAEAVRILDEYLAQPKANLIVPISLIDDLGQQGDADAVRFIAILTRVAPFKSEFGYRRCVVQALSRIREPAAVGFLIEMLAGSQGLVQAEIIESLTRSTRQKFKDNDREWRLWWMENQAKFQFPAERAAAEPVDENPVAYYGIPICAKRVVFVLDTSISMRGQPMEAAKLALLKTVESLPGEVNFDIIMFDQSATVWQPRLLPATLSAKQAAAQAVRVRGMKIGTASHAALNAAFNLDPEVIYFLSDGEPTDGQPAQIVESMSERNRTRRITIHTIGVVTKRGGGAGLTFFMKPLAEHNFGVFQLVE